VKLPPTDPKPARARPWRAYAAVLALALLPHALVLRALPGGATEGAARQPSAVMQVRSITPSPVHTAAPAAPTLTTAATAAPATPAAIKRKSPAAPAATPAPPHDAAAASEALPAGPSAAAPTTIGAAATPDADRPGQALPTYATRLAPPVALSYDMRRGGMRGEAQLVWQPRGESYTLSLTANAAMQPLLGLASRGGFDAAGIAPERFVNRRRGREQSAANFQREQSRISFSSSTASVEMPAGAQDRLSWMLQLPAIVHAAPQRFTPGARIALFVAGVRGDAEVWRFSVEATETLQLPDGQTRPTLMLVREPSRPYDSRVEVWLDPAMHHLPLRLRWTSAAPGAGQELWLTQTNWLPP
jgi:Protein of unknown function (DUF3108)